MAEESPEARKSRLAERKRVDDTLEKKKKEQRTSRTPKKAAQPEPKRTGMQRLNHALHGSW